MQKPYSTANVYNDFSQLIDHIDEWLKKSILPALTMNKNIVHQRLLQRLVEYGFIPYVKFIQFHLDADSLNKNTQSHPLYNNKVINLQGVLINPITGSVEIAKKTIFRFFLEFSAHWGLMLIAIVSGMRPTKDMLPSVLVYGIGSESLFFNGTDERFVAFCNQAEITPLKHAKHLLIQSSKNQGVHSNQRFVYVKYPQLEVVKGASIGSFARFILLLKHFIVPIIYLGDCIKFSPYALLARDYAQLHAISVFDKAKKIEAIVITNSSGKVQPMWMRVERNFSVHMVWYSQNTRPHNYYNNNIEAKIPHIPHVVADVHWVWTNGYRDYLNKTLNHHGKIMVVGPILWYLPTEDISANGGFTISVFDVIPLKESLTADFGMIDNYYSGKNMCQFLTDLVNLCSEISTKTNLKFNINLKHKRIASNSFFDAKYLELITDLETQGKIKLIDHQSNIYSMISESNLCVTIPYSSPVFVATYLGKLAVYFDPTSQLSPDYEELNGLSFCAGKEELAITINGIINNLYK